MVKTLMVCTLPEGDNAYIGGIATLCNDYIENKGLFAEQDVELVFDNYHPITKNLFDKIRNSKWQNILYAFRQYSHIKRILHNGKFDVIHIHTSRRYLFAKDVILLSALRKKFKGSIVLTIHVGAMDTVFANKLVRKIFLRLLNLNLDKVIFLTEKMRQEFIAKGLEPDRSITLYNFYNIKNSPPHPTSDIPEILYLGSINTDKGIRELMDAALRLNKPFHLNICGTIIEEQIRSPFYDAINKLGEKVTYHGYVGKEKKTQLLEKADILVLPSYREGFPVSILEAMASGCAIITTPVGAIPEVLTSNNAEIVSPRDAEALVNAFNHLLENPDRLDSMKMNNFESSSQFSLKANIVKLCQIYKG